ncbi:hypothetical protein [Enterococcus sp. NPDC086594]|uniref:hypothetical protein n=1 Tax=Enterococcus sp. NPDC086594 TaxID=3363992 RepID=UPI0038165D6F
MGRYSFFILGFFYRGNYVHADSFITDVLSDRGSLDSNSNSNRIVDSSFGYLDSVSSTQEENSSDKSNNEESSETNPTDKLGFEYYDLSNPHVFGNVSTEISPRKADTVYAGPNNGWNIAGYFVSWRLDGTLTPAQVAHNIDMIVRQSRNSFAGVNSRLNGLENWRTAQQSLNSTYGNNITSLNSRVTQHTTQISNAFSRISNLETWQGQQRTWNTATGNSISSLNSWRTAQQNLNTTYGNNISSLNNWRTAQQQLNSTYGNNLSSLNTWQGQQRSWNTMIGNNVTTLNNWRSAQQDLNSVYGKNLENLNNWQGQQRTWNTIIGNNVTSLNNWRNAQQDLNSVFGKNLENLNNWQGQQRTWNTTIGNNVTSLNNWRSDQQDLNSVFGKNLENLNTWQGQQRDWNSMIGNNVTALNVWQTAQVALNAVHGNAIASNSSRITEIEKSLNSWNWTDAAIIAAILGLHDTWKSDDYMGPILDNDGDAVKLMKAVAIRISSSITEVVVAINSLARNIQAQFDFYFTDGGFFWEAYDKRWNNLPLWLQGLLNNYFDHIYNVNNKDSLLYRLLYAFMEEMDKTRFFIIEINDNIIIANDSLLLIIDWLRMIYSKPPLIVPPFDYDRLQKMLEELSFGNIVNEAGTNFWDFLTELIKTLGDILTTALTSLTDIVKEILDILGDLINQIIKLIVPENIDFIDEGFGSIKIKLDAKFDGFLSLGGQIVEVVQPIDAEFKEVISIDIMGAQFAPDFNTIDWVVVRFRTVMALSIWLSVAIYIFRKITGNGDLINDN